MKKASSSQQTNKQTKNNVIQLLLSVKVLEYFCSLHMNLIRKFLFFVCLCIFIEIVSFHFLCSYIFIYLSDQIDFIQHKSIVVCSST